MNILIDTNIVIPLEPTSPADVEEKTGAAADLVALCGAQHRLMVHASSLDELTADPDENRRAMREVLTRKYNRLESPPGIPAEFAARIGRSQRGTNDWVDDTLLAAVSGHAVAFLVTEDGGIHSKAAKLGLSDRVLSVEDALTFLRNLEGGAARMPPFVERVLSYQLDEADPIFDSIREDYGAPFDPWFAKCKEEHRPSVVIMEDGALAGLCILKDAGDELGLGARTLKICTFKVAPERQGRLFGELLLKSVFQETAAKGYKFAFVTVLPKYEALIALLQDFGFAERRRFVDGELEMLKTMSFTEEDKVELDRLEFHVRFGPPAIAFADQHIFVVPIVPRYHRLLFPDAEAEQAQLPLLPDEPRPFGNALRKAYLCRSGIRRIEPGDCLLFYRSHEEKGVSCVGVVEDTMVSAEAAEIAAFVGQRTVYTLKQIEAMCSEGEVLAIRFRQDRLLTRPMTERELVSKRVMKRAPQSIASVAPEVTEWLAARLDE
jgi:L-amino acid N-acyltransferase YncA